MLKVILRRVLISIPLLVIVSFFVFVLIDFVPGDAATSLAGENATPEQVAEIRSELGLDDPLFVRYGRWLGNAATGDLGESLQTSESVSGLIWRRAAVTLSLVFVALVFTALAALTLGVLAALRPGGAVDRLITATAAIAVSVPPFWLALVLVSAFAINRQYLPALGYAPLGDGLWEWLRHLILPAIALAMLPGAELTVQLKSALAEVLGRDHILTNRGMGLKRTSMVLKHGLKNAAIPVVTVLGFRLAQMIGGAVTIEAVFALNGIGALALNSTTTRDVPVLLGLVVFTSLAVIVVNLVVDASYGYFNPRARS
jgi:peptide/nickel transport system permease protein